MDVLYFFRERTRFIRQFYDTAASPFTQAISAIDEGSPPFDNPPYSEDGEPPYLNDWDEASDALEVLGRTCISMMSASLKLYFLTWERELGVTCDTGERKRAFRRGGFLGGYKVCFFQVAGVPWDGCPADLVLIEQMILARHRDQHPDEISTMHVHHTKNDRDMHSHFFFMNESDTAMFTDDDMQDVFFIGPKVYVSREHLLRAIEETERLADWLEPYLLTAAWGQ